MNWLHSTIENDLAQLKEVHNIEPDKYELEQVEILLIQERAEMEMILADEVLGWEEKLREYRVGVLDWLVSNRGMDRKRVRSWKRGGEQTCGNDWRTEGQRWQQE
jgi:hypothetical protein